MQISGFKAMFKNRLRREEIYPTAEYWDLRGEQWPGHFACMWPNNNLNYYYHREQLELINKHLPDINGAYVLDVGCGTGRSSRYLAKRGGRVLGIDFSPKAIEAAKRQSAGDNPSYKVESIFNISEKSLFDIVVICGGVLTMACKNSAELFDVMVRLRESLKENGKILLWEPICKGFFHRVLNMDVREFSEIMTRAGFEIKDITNLHFFPLHLLLAYFPLPKLITVSGYYLGKWIMDLSGNHAWGDYKCIYASVQRK
ncbi:class I SAM-dependent methyltransferase [Candidatus Pacearchaeota archaeon]|nr:class I SAM-dependent methyltransferase [Candidatus Pacearchaeota archaeon]